MTVSLDKLNKMFNDVANFLAMKDKVSSGFFVHRRGTEHAKIDLF